MNAVDTNVLIYVYDPRDTRKQSIASDLVVNMVEGVLLWQVACEFLSAGRKLVPLGYNFERAYADVQELARNWTIALPSWEVLDRAMMLLGRFSLSYWDALLVAACLQAGVTTLYTEDLGGCPEIDGLKVINPFISAN